VPSGDVSSGDTCQAPGAAAARNRRLAGIARSLCPPAAVARAVATGDRPLTSPLVRAWLDRVLALPPSLVLLVLARARWFLPHAAPVRRQRAVLARALLDALGGQIHPIDHHLAAFLLLPGRRSAPDSAPVLRRGLAAYAAGDDVTCLHLLVPGVEALLRERLVEPLATVTAVMSRPSLPALLRQAVDHPELGVGLAGAIHDVLLAGGDDSLRHRLAHGRLPAAACTRPISQEIILALLRLARPGLALTDRLTTDSPSVPARVPA
jgi:hypothetical protein